MPEAWERRENETDKAYAAFSRYRDLGPDERSLDRVAELLYPPKEGQPGRKRAATGRIKEWSRTNGWVERAKAYDDHMDEIIRKRLEAKRVRSAEKQMELAEKMREKALARVESIEGKDLTPQDVARWVDVATKTERLALGEPTEIGKQQITLPNILEVTLDDGDQAEAAPRTDPGVEK